MPRLKASSSTSSLGSQGNWNYRQGNAWARRGITAATSGMAGQDVGEARKEAHQVDSRPKRKTVILERLSGDRRRAVTIRGTIEWEDGMA